jgi:hypothetical protein
MNGDFDLDGDVDFGDYMILEAAFGDTVPVASAAAVPEPEAEPLAHPDFEFDTAADG